MDAGGRATHGAVAEETVANQPTDGLQIRKDL